MAAAWIEERCGITILELDCAEALEPPQLTLELGGTR